jgi:phosphoribosylanthranilate isomerase
MTAVKVCGITRREDAELAAALGAFAVGFVFASSPRRVTPESARAIAAALPPGIERVGVFQDEELAKVRAIAAAVPLTRVQLHGDEAPAVAAGLPFLLTRAFDGEAADLDLRVDAWRAARPDVRILLDLRKPLDASGPAPDPARIAAHWERAAALARRVPLLLAGGLDASNVAAALARVRPAAVDVARGVESEPGVKDRTRLEAFFGAVARFDREQGAPR